MKSAGWYLMHEGRKILAATIGEARHLAQLVADQTGKPVTVKKMKAAPAARKATAPARRTMKRNPDAGSYLPVWNELEKHRRQRLDYLAGTKARRLAKGLRGKDRGGAVKAAERGAQKTGKFEIEAKNSRERLTLYRASRAAADQLVSQFIAAGYKVVLREV